MEKIYTIGRFDKYSDGSFRLEEKFTTESPYWKVVEGKIYYVHWDVVNKQYIERATTEMKMSKEEALAEDCYCYYQILETTDGKAVDMSKQYVKSICNGKVIFMARIYKLLTGRYSFETSENGKPFEVNMNMPTFPKREDAENWIENNSEWKLKE